MSKKSPASFNNPDRQTLAETDVEGLGLAVMTLAKEIWITRDRMMVMEKVLAEKGIDIGQEIDRFQPDESFQAELSEQGQALIQTVLSALNKKD